MVHGAHSVPAWLQSTYAGDWYATSCIGDGGSFTCTAADGWMGKQHAATSASVTSSFAAATLHASPLTIISTPALSCALQSEDHTHTLYVTCVSGRVGYLHRFSSAPLRPPQG